MGRTLTALKSRREWHGRRADGVFGEHAGQGQKLSELSDGTRAQLILRGLYGKAGLEVMQGLYALEKQHKADEAERQFDNALAAFMNNPPVIVKRQKNNHANYTYANLADCCAAIDESLKGTGIRKTWRTDQTMDKDGKIKSIKVTCILKGFGHSEQTSLESPLDDNKTGMTQIQRIKSTVSYLERTTLLAVLGLPTYDDDGQTAGDKDPKADPLKPKPVNLWREKYGRLIDEESEGLTAQDFNEYCIDRGRIRKGQTWKDLQENRAKQHLEDWPDFSAAVREFKDGIL